MSNIQPVQADIMTSRDINKEVVISRRVLKQCKNGHKILFHRGTSTCLLAQSDEN